VYKCVTLIFVGECVTLV